MRHSRAALATIALVLTAALSPAVASAGTITPVATLQLELGSCKIIGDATDISGNLLTIKHRNAAGKLKATHQASTSSGQFSTGCPGPAVRSGDRLQLFQGTNTVPFRTFKVPTLTLATDRVKDTLRGTATGGVSSIEVLVSRCDAAFFGCTGIPLPDLLVDPETHRFALTTEQDLAGGWQVELDWTKGGDRVGLTQDVGRLVIQPGSATVLGAGRSAGQRVSVSVRRGQKVGAASPRTRSDAHFTARIKRGGSPMAVKAGDVVSASFAGNATLTVPPTGIDYDFGLEQVSGRCFKDRHVQVLVTDFAGGLATWGSDTASATGAWSVDIGPISAGWTITAWCANARGDAIKLALLLN